MAIETVDQLSLKIRVSMGSSKELLEPEEYNFASSQALNELGWSLPINDPKRIYWIIERGKRHSLDILRTQAANKFRYKDLSLNHRFNHYNSLINDLDAKFEKALDTDPDLLGISDMFMVFGTYIENGIVYDQYGNDISKILNSEGIDNDGYRHRIV